MFLKVKCKIFYNDSEVLQVYKLIYYFNINELSHKIFSILLHSTSQAILSYSKWLFSS